MHAVYRSAASLPIVVVVLFCLGTMPMASAATVNVTVGSNFFSPASSTININDTVTWTWSGNNHSTTSDSSLWNSGVRNSGATFSHQFTSAGTFPYHCSVHAGQTGSIRAQAPNTPPTVTITSPTNGSVFTAPASFTFAASASDPGGSVTNVQFIRGTTSLGNDPSNPYSVAVNNLAAGNYTLSAVASDNNGARATNSISISVQLPNTPPTITITSPTNGGVFTAPASFAFAANASDPGGSVTNVQFLRDTTSLGNDTTIPYSVAVNNLAAGSYTLSAVATDNLGARATNSVSIIANALPTVGISSPTNGSIFAAPFGGTIQANATDSDGTINKVDFYTGSTLLGSDGGAPYQLIVSNLTAGTYTLMAVAADNRGASNTSAGITISVVTSVPIVLSSPQRSSSTQFVFMYTASVGLRYRVDRSVNLSNWTGIRTNTATTNRMMQLDNTASNRLNFYRVERLPNP